MWIKELSPSAFIFMIHVAARVDLEESVRGIRTLTSAALEDCLEQCVTLALDHVGNQIDRTVSDHHGYTYWAINY